jgi:hypothetical protein
MQAFAAMYDPAGVAYIRLSAADRSEAATKCGSFTLAALVHDTGVELSSLADPAVLAGVIREANARIVGEVQRLVDRNEHPIVLVCARRVPREWIRQFLEQAFDRSLDEQDLRHVESEYPQLVANIVLDRPPAPADRRPPHTKATLLDGLRIALLCALHRMHAFNLNTMVRFEFSGDPSDTGLISSYVHRSAQASDIKSDLLAYADRTEAEGITGLTSRRGMGSTTITLTASKQLGDQHLVLANFVPITISSARDRRWFGYLRHTHAAVDLGGLSFERWWACWLRLNEVAASWLAEYDPPSRTDAADAAERERLRICCAAHNLGMIEVDRDRLSVAALRPRASGSISRAEFYSFTESVTWRPGAQQTEFIESPAIFSPAGRTTVFWDLLRHGGVLPGLARRVAWRCGGLGNTVGEYFEGQVHAELAGHPAVTHLRSDVVIGTERQRDLQIDHGFVVSGLLVLVESKSNSKTPGYFTADEEQFDKRAKRVVGDVLSGRDRKLSELRDKIAAKWAAASPSCALYVICTTEVEYIPSEDPLFWLDRGRDLPRVCTLDELLNWLADIDETVTMRHPSCVALPTKPRTET